MTRAETMAQRAAARVRAAARRAVLWTVDDPRIQPEPNTGCWLWTAAVGKEGYAVTTARRGATKGTASVHRMTWDRHRSTSSVGFVVNHVCRERSCVNPDHLALARPVGETFWESVVRRGSDDCWEWSGPRNRQGYGTSRSLVAGIRAKAHRVAWMLSRGSIPDGIFVCHHCDNPPCCNPAHLFLGTHAENMRDMVQKDRGPRMKPEKTHCINGHAYTEQNTAWEPSVYSRGKKRHCRRCHADNQARYLRRRQTAVGGSDGT